MQTYDFPRPVYTKEFSKDVPERLLDHQWQRTVDFNKLPKIQLKVRMCCAKCEEKVLEEIWEVPGVFDVRAHRMENKVVVTAAVGVDEYPAVDQYAVLRKARKIDSRARFVELDSKERLLPPKPISSQSKVEVDKDHRQGKDGRGGPDRPPQPQPLQHRPPPPEYLPPLSQSYVEYEPDYTHSPSQDGMTPFYFLFLVLLLVSMYVFRR